MNIFFFLASFWSIFANEVPENLLQEMQRTIDKCGFFMELALLCPTPALQKSAGVELNTNLWFVRGGLIRKYTHRLSQVFLDAIHHVEQNKCSVNSSFEAQDNGFETVLEHVQRTQFLKTNVPKTLVEEIGGYCLKDVKNVLGANNLQKCGKRGSWLRRATHVIKDINKKKNSCRKIVASVIQPK